MGFGLANKITPVPSMSYVIGRGAMGASMLPFGAIGEGTGFPDGDDDEDGGGGAAQRQRRHEHDERHQESQHAETNQMRQRVIPGAGALEEHIADEIQRGPA